MINEEVTRNHLVTRRTFLLQVAKFSTTCVLASRLLYLQLIKGAEYKILSDNNRINLMILYAKRGVIKDKFQVIIAQSRPCFAVYLDKRLEKNYLNSAHKLFELFGLQEEVRVKLITKIKKTPKRIPVALVSNASWQQIAILEEHIELVPGIYAEQFDVRDYKIPEAFAHITGYVGRIAEDDAWAGNINSKFYVGKTGIEKYYENHLAGQAGYKKIEIDAKGVFVRELEKQEPIQGEDLKINLDSRLQEMIYDIMPPEGASAIVMDISTGGLVACVSKGAYNPNDFASGITHDSWNQLNNSNYKPLVNKICSSQYPPGSTFKLITVLAALEAGILPSQKFYCSGYITIGNRNFNCWKREGHRLVDMKEAIKQSCNCYMFNISKIIKVDKILDMARKFGLGGATGIDLPYELPGFVPDRTWKFKNFNYGWTVGDGFNLSIGQGALLATPIQLANIIAKIASCGSYNANPKIVSDNLIENGTKPSSINILSHIKYEHFEFIKNAMDHTVNEAGGSAFHHRSNIVRYAGKTGTSQVIAKKNVNDDLSRDTIAWSKRNHALFSGFFPAEAPKYAMSIIVDHGGGGARAACPIAKQIVEFCALNNII